MYKKKADERVQSASVERNTKEKVRFNTNVFVDHVNFEQEPDEDIQALPLGNQVPFFPSLIRQK